jgi:uncharacterized protein YlaN (UPF0358 family)
LEIFMMNVTEKLLKDDADRIATLIQDELDMIAGGEGPGGDSPAPRVTSGGTG